MTQEQVPEEESRGGGALVHHRRRLVIIAVGVTFLLAPLGIWVVIWLLGM